MKMETNNWLVLAGLGMALAAAGFFLGKQWPAESPPATSARIATALGTPAAVAKPAKPDLNPRDMAALLRKGGYILYFRHAQRQKWDSVVAFDVYDLARGEAVGEAAARDAVCLSAQGREEAKMIGRIFELAKIPVGTVAASPLCRARQTAELAFGHVDLLSMGLAHTPVTNPANFDAFASELKRVLSTVPVAPGKNTVIAGHGNTIENHKGVFSQGADLLSGALIGETGFYVIQRDAAGRLAVLQKYQQIGDFAASAIDLPVAVAPVAGRR